MGKPHMDGDENMSRCGNNKVVVWVREMRVAGTGSTVYTSPSSMNLEIGNFAWVGASVEVLAGGSAAAFMQFEHAIDPDGRWDEVLKTSSPDERIELTARNKANVGFEADAEGNLLFRFLRFTVTDTTDFDISFKMTVLLRR
jgi:hypothetical protein